MTCFWARSSNADGPQYAVNYWHNHFDKSIEQSKKYFLIVDIFQKLTYWIYSLNVRTYLDALLNLAIKSSFFSYQNEYSIRVEKKYQLVFWYLTSRSYNDKDDCYIVRVENGTKNVLCLLFALKKIRTSSSFYLSITAVFFISTRLYNMKTNKRKKENNNITTEIEIYII